MSLTSIPLLTALALVPVGGPGPSTPHLPPALWGKEGHVMAGRVAAAHLPPSMPGFFSREVRRLGWLNYEPDRWRSDDLYAMAEAFRYDHYIDLENVPEGALEAPDRYRYLREVFETELEEPVRDTGLLPYRILETYQRLLTGFVRWRRASGTREARWIQELIVNDAGILGHYVTDASQPHHTTIHYNGWAPGAPNPEGYTRSDDIHWRFESLFVSAHVAQSDVDRRMRRAPRTYDDVWGAILTHIREAHAEVETLYRLERDVGFDPEAEATPRTRDFAAERLAAGASMLRDLWWTAWVRSGETIPSEGPGQ